MGEALLAIAGLFSGGVLNVAVDRLAPSGASLEAVPGRGGRPIAIWEWLPIFSLAGALRQRRTAYPNNRLRYPALELVTAALFALAWSRFGESPFVLIAVCALTASLVALAFIDLETTYLPDSLVLPTLVVALAFSPFWPDRPWWIGLAGAALGYAVFFPLAWLGDRLDRDIMGWGDVKLSAALGAVLGVYPLLLGLYIGVLAGGIVGIAVYAGRMFGFRRAIIPYGPYLALGGIVAMYYAQPLGEWIKTQVTG